MARTVRIYRAGVVNKPSLGVLRGLYAACNVALAAFEAASDGSGDVTKTDAMRIEAAMIWIRNTAGWK